jgi:hypothetical protein
MRSRPAVPRGELLDHTAVRSTSRGKPAQFTENFGIGGPGLMIARITAASEGTSVKMAA